MSNKQSVKEQTANTNGNRRSFLTATALVASTALLKAQEKKVDGGLAVIEKKKYPTGVLPYCLPVHKAPNIWHNTVLHVNYAYRYAPIKYCVHLLIYKN